jgi:hypothetical protein
MSDINFEQIRAENDEKLLADLPAIRSGERFDALISFAKAYLGLFAIIDDCHDACLRVHMLANDDLADAALEGIVAALGANFPPPGEIGESIVREDHLPSGYIALAGVDQLAHRDKQAVTSLPDNLLKSALCFHYANQTALEPVWIDMLMEERIELVAEALLEMWQGMIRLGTDYLPAYNQLYTEKKYRRLVTLTVLRLLESWQDCRDKNTRELLQLALRYADHDQLLSLAEKRLQDEEHMSVNRRVYWRATAFLLSPAGHANALMDYVDRSKERALRLLDFVYSIMQEGDGQNIGLSAMTKAQLIRMIAPKFTPRVDAYGTLNEIERKVVWLFRSLEEHQDDAKREAIHWLQSVRVMRGTLRYFDALPGEL